MKTTTFSKFLIVAIFGFTVQFVFGQNPYINFSFAGAGGTTERLTPVVTNGLFSQTSNIAAFNNAPDGLHNANADVVGLKVAVTYTAYSSSGPYMGYSFTPSMELPVTKIEGKWKRGNKNTAPTNVRIQIKGGGATPSALYTLYNDNNTTTITDMPFSVTLPEPYVIPQGSASEIRIYIWYTNGYSDNTTRTALTFYNIDLSGTAVPVSTLIEYVEKPVYTAFFTGDKLNISGLSNETVNIYNLLGKSLFTGTANALENLSISEKGLFLIQINGEIYKVIK